jgi:hypothetical protein
MPEWCLSRRDWCSGGASAADRLARKIEVRVKVLQGAEAQRRASEGAAVNDYGACLSGGARCWFGVGGSRTDAAEFCTVIML